ncbi:MAG: hypothetical protein ACRC7N_04520 [Clostridium sp.]
MDGTQRTNGIVLFNLNDKSMYSGDMALASVYITPKVSNQWCEIVLKSASHFLENN